MMAGSRASSPLVPALVHLLLVLTLATTAFGYSFQFTTWPMQCGPLSLAIVQGRGTPPYRLLLVPLGDRDTRRVIEFTFSDETNATLARLPYPENTQFVAMLSDASGVGTGGTSVALSVVTSNDRSCLSPPLPAPDFTFSVDAAPRQCGPAKFSWNASAVQAPLTLYGIIPGGQSFALPVPDPSAGTFQWTATILLHSSVIFTAGDARGRANGGRSELFTLSGPPPGQPPPPLPPGVSPGANGGPPDYCLTNGGYSTTTGDPAGGIYPTGSSMPTPSTGTDTMVSSTSTPSVGVLVGGVVAGVGGLFILGLVGFLLYRRRNFTNRVRAAKRRSAAVDLDDKVLDHPESPTGDHLVPRPLSNHLEPGMVEAMTFNGGAFVNGDAATNGDYHAGANGGAMGGAGARKQRLSLSPVTPRPLPIDSTTPPLSPIVRFTDTSSAGPGIFPSPAASEAGDTRSSQRPNSAGTGSTPTTSRRKSASATSAAAHGSQSGVLPSPVLRSVTYIQHDDAGSLSHGHSDEAAAGGVHRVIELPPSYVERRRSVRSGSGGPRSDEGSGEGRTPTRTPTRTSTRTTPNREHPPSSFAVNDSTGMSSESEDRFHSFEEERPVGSNPASASGHAPGTTEGRETRVSP